jgi:hypothetical protein
MSFFAFDWIRNFHCLCALPPLCHSIGWRRTIIWQWYLILDVCDNIVPCLLREEEILSLYFRTFLTAALVFLRARSLRRMIFPFCFKSFSSDAILALKFGILLSTLYRSLVLKGSVLPWERNESFRAASYLDVEGLTFSCSWPNILVRPLGGIGKCGNHALMAEELWFPVA